MCHNYSKKAFVRLKTQIVIMTLRQKRIVHSKYYVYCAVLLLLVLIRSLAGNLRIILSESAGNELFSRLPTSLTLMIVFFFLQSIISLTWHRSLSHCETDHFFYSRSYSRGPPWETFVNGQYFLSQIYKYNQWSDMNRICL